MIFVAIFGDAALMAFANKWDGHLHDRKGCVRSQEIQNKVLKVDACTGEVTEFDVDSKMNDAKTVKRP